MEIIYEQNSAKSEVSTSNSALREVYSNGLEKSESPLSAFATQFLETVANDAHCSTDLEELITVAAGEGKNPVSVLTETCCEEMAHPHLFHSGKYDYKVQRNITLSASKYFNQRLLNYLHVFAADRDYIFFTHSVMQKKLVKQSN